jgi:hypothetical protein
MTIHEYLMKAVGDDARRAGERDRLLRQARRARRARRQRLVPAAPAGRRTEIGKVVVSENVTHDGVTHDPAGDAGFRAAGALLQGRRSYEWFTRAVAISQRRAGRQAEQPAQVRRVRDPRQSRLEQSGSPQERRA